MPGPGAAMLHTADVKPRAANGLSVFTILLGLFWDLQFLPHLISNKIVNSTMSSIRVSAAGRSSGEDNLYKLYSANTI